jgi:hypothetical protein
VSYADDTLDLPDGDTAVGRVLPFTVGAGSGVGRLEKAAKVRDDISGELTEQDLHRRRRGPRLEHGPRRKRRLAQAKAKDALDAAAQEDPEAKTYPFAPARRTSAIRC